MEQKQMTPSGPARESIGQLLSRLGVFLVTAAIVAVAMETAWRDWTVFALGLAAVYFMGGARWFPWGTPIRKAFSIGVFVGTSLPTIEWVYKLYH
jgi:hypothetical protein